MPTLSSTIQKTRSKFAIAVPRCRSPPVLLPVVSLYGFSFRRSPHSSTLPGVLPRLREPLTISRRLSILMKERHSCESLNFFLRRCVLESEEVCDGSKLHSQALFSCFSDPSHRGRRDYPL